MAILLLNICRPLTWPYVFVLLWGWKDKLLGRGQQKHAWYGLHFVRRKPVAGAGFHGDAGQAA
jgi:hypothetical protein